MELEAAFQRLTAPPVLFAVPLKSAQVATDWQAVQDRLRDTLATIRSQTDPNCLAIICGNEEPDLSGFEDIAVWLPVDWPAPTSSSQFSGDKTRKRDWIAKSIRPHIGDGAYIFWLDADDLLAPNVVEHIRTDHNQQGYYAKDGYLWDQETGDIAKNRPRREFHQHCGSCGAVWMTQADLPRRMSDKDQLWSKVRAHTNFVEGWEANGRKLEPLPFRALIYILNHGQNNTQVKQSARGAIDVAAADALPEKEKRKVLQRFGLEVFQSVET